MRARFYPDAMARAGLELITPRADEQAFIHDKYIHELLENQFLPETRGAFIAIVERMRQDEGIEALLLAGTELPLILRGAEPEGLSFLDTTMIHVAAAVEAIIN
jgi:aspartate racemase